MQQQFKQTSVIKQLELPHDLDPAVRKLFDGNSNRWSRLGAVINGDKNPLIAVTNGYLVKVLPSGEVSVSSNLLETSFRDDGSASSPIAPSEDRKEWNFTWDFKRLEVLLPKTEHLAAAKSSQIIRLTGEPAVKEVIADPTSHKLKWERIVRNGTEILKTKLSGFVIFFEFTTKPDSSMEVAVSAAHYNLFKKNPPTYETFPVTANSELLSMRQAVLDLFIRSEQISAKPLCWDNFGKNVIRVLNTDLGQLAATLAGTPSKPPSAG